VHTDNRLAFKAAPDSISPNTIHPEFEIILLTQHREIEMKHLALAIVVFTLAACGGGGDSSFEPTDPNTVLQLFPAGGPAPGTFENRSLTGLT
jgi:hypothetical protein